MARWAEWWERRPEWLRSKGVLVYPPILHDNLEVLGGIGDQVDILQWTAVDQQQIGKRALFHDAELARIRTAFAGQCQQFGVGSGRHGERVGRTVPSSRPDAAQKKLILDRSSQVLTDSLKDELNGGADGWGKKPTAPIA